MHAEIVSIGDEITSGQLLDTNSQWLSLRLEELGAVVLYHTSVGDQLDAIVEVFKQAMRRSDVIVVTGGLGPTADDLTRDALAKATGRELVLDPIALEHIERLFARRKRPMPKTNELQALFPEGSQIIPNPNGTAPGIDIESPRPSAVPSRLFALPGVPAEMKEMWQQTVVDRLLALGAGQTVIRHRRIKCFGAGESQMEAMLPDLVRRGREPRVGINASQATIIFRVTSSGATDEAARAAAEPTVQTIRECLGDLVIGEEDDELHDAVIRLLNSSGKSLATVEWGTTGLVADWLGSAAGSDTAYRGGLVVNSQEAVRRALDLSAKADSLSEDGEKLVIAMASACRARWESDVALAIGPLPRIDPATSNPGDVCYGLATTDSVIAKRAPLATHPAIRKVLAAKQALDMVRRALLPR